MIILVCLRTGGVVPARFVRVIQSEFNVTMTLNNISSNETAKNIAIKKRITNGIINEAKNGVSKIETAKSCPVSTLLYNLHQFLN